VWEVGGGAWRKEFQGNGAALACAYEGKLSSHSDRGKWKDWLSIAQRWLG
jgi:hypothetical protein